MKKDHGLPSRREFGALLLGLLAAGPAFAVDAPDAFASNFAGLRLRDQDDRDFAFGSLAGRVLLVNFVFTGCSSTCPLQTQALAQVQAGLPADIRQGVHFVSVSLDPLTDTPSALKAYAARFAIDHRHWSFVTGQPMDVGRFAERLKLFRADRGPRRLEDHNTALWLVDAKGRLMQRLHGQPVDARRLHDELVALRRMA